MLETKGEFEVKKIGGSLFLRLPKEALLLEEVLIGDYSGSIKIDQVDDKIIIEINKIKNLPEGYAPKIGGGEKNGRKSIA